MWRMSSPIYYNADSVTRFKKRKARFTFSEVHILLDEVRKHRAVVVGMLFLSWTHSSHDQFANRLCFTGIHL